MKRSGQVGLVLMGAATFAATFVAGTAFFAWKKPSHAAQPQPVASTPNCTTRPDGTQNCSSQRGFAYYLLPRFIYSPGGATSASEPKPRAQSAALTNSSRAYTPAVSASGTTRGGFGSTAQSGSYRTSAGG